MTLATAVRDATKTDTHVLRVLDPHDPREVTWEPGDGHVARALFTKLYAGGWVVYQVDEKTGDRVHVHEFDPKANVLEARPQIIGG